MRRPPRRWPHRRARPFPVRPHTDRREPGVRFRNTMSDPSANRFSPPAGGPPSCPVPAADDGIRWELVYRMKRLIAEGKLDTPDRWALAEELMFRATEDGR
jgi:hypothetical protein